MSEYYKSEKGYYYKKTKKNKSRITKEEYGKAMNGGGLFNKPNPHIEQRQFENKKGIKRVIENKEISDGDIVKLLFENKKTNERIDKLEEDVEFFVTQIKVRVANLTNRVKNLENQ